MEVTRESLSKRYASMETQELVEITHTSDLTEQAKEVLEEVLGERGATVEIRAQILEEIDREANKYVPLASTGSRFVAQILDGIIALLLLVVPFVLFVLFRPFGDAGLWLGIGAYIVYLLFQDGLPNGQSLGKRIVGIRVVSKASGCSCGLGSSFIRNIILLVLGVIDLLFLGSKYRQRLGDMAAKTIVVNVDGKSGEF
jgi:uncharacterized RDD family membrane protein YckC